MGHRAMAAVDTRRAEAAAISAEVEAAVTRAEVEAAVTRAEVEAEVIAVEEAEATVVAVTGKFGKVAANELKTEARKGALNGALFLFACSRSDGKRSDKAV